MAAKPRFVPVLLLILCLPCAHAVGKALPDAEEATPHLDAISWQQMTDEQRSELIKRFQDVKKLQDEDSAELQQRMNWFSQLPKPQQQKMREAWQNMSVSERSHWRTKLKQATPEQREDLRQKILDKYD